MRVMTLGGLGHNALAPRRQFYGVGQLRQRPVNTLLVLFAAGASLAAMWFVYDRFTRA